MRSSGGSVPGGAHPAAPRALESRHHRDPLQAITAALSFADPALEEEYQKEHALSCRSWDLYGTIIIVALWSAFLLRVDWDLSPRRRRILVAGFANEMLPGFLTFLPSHIYAASRPWVVALCQASHIWLSPDFASGGDMEVMPRLDQVSTLSLLPHMILTSKSVALAFTLLTRRSLLRHRVLSLALSLPALAAANLATCAGRDWTPAVEAGVRRMATAIAQASTLGMAPVHLANGDAWETGGKHGADRIACSLCLNWSLLVLGCVLPQVCLAKLEMDSRNDFARRRPPTPTLDTSALSPISMLLICPVVLGAAYILSLAAAILPRMADLS